MLESAMTPVSFTKVELRRKATIDVTFKMTIIIGYSGLPFPLCPQRPIYCLAFRSTLSTVELSVDAPAFIPASMVSDVRGIKPQNRPFVKYLFPHSADKLARPAQIIVFALRRPVTSLR